MMPVIRVIAPITLGMLLWLVISLPFSYNPSPHTQRSVAHVSSASLVKKVLADTQNFCLEVPVLLYHHVQPAATSHKLKQESLSVDPYWFEQHIIYLKNNGYTFYSVYDLVDALLHRTSLPGRPVILTIDDGYEDNYQYAYPLAKMHEVPIDLMIPTGLIGTDGYLTWDQIHEMESSRVVRFTNHTVSHYPLGISTDSARMEYEVGFAHDMLSQMLSSNISIVTYPYGSYSDQAIDILKRHGVTAAFTTEHSFIQCSNNIYKLHRDHAGNAPLSSYGL